MKWWCISVYLVVCDGYVSSNDVLLQCVGLLQDGATAAETAHVWYREEPHATGNDDKPWSSQCTCNYLWNVFYQWYSVSTNDTVVLIVTVLNLY